MKKIEEQMYHELLELAFDDMNHNLNFLAETQDVLFKKLNESDEALNRKRKYIAEVEWSVRNLFLALGSQIVNSEILTRLNKP